MPCNIKNEFHGLRTGDVRLDRRFVDTAEVLCATPDLSVSASCHSASDVVGAYRVIHSALVTPKKILAPHRVSTVERARGCEGSLLLVQDTTEIDHTSHKATRGLGPLSNKPCRGFFLHSQLLLAEKSAVPLGFCSAQIMTRLDKRPELEIPKEPSAPTGHTKAAKKRPPPRPIEEKESMRWLLGFREACALALELPGREVISMADREGDIFDIFAEYQALKRSGEAHAQLIIRVETDRVLEGDAKLFATAYAAPVVGNYEVAISATMQKVKTATGSSAKKMRQKRTAHMEVRIVALSVPAPERHFKKLPAVELCAVLVSEKEPPEGQDPIEWLLWTSLPVTTLKEALRVVRAYSLRWRIEEFHRVLKSGCKIEALRFADAHSLHNLLALYMIIAWRILYLRDFARAMPLAPGSAFFSAAEWKSTCIMNDRSLKQAPPLGEMLLMVAAFGGYKKRGKKNPPPGPEVIWRGLTKLQHFTEMASKLGAL